MLRFCFAILFSSAVAGMMVGCDRVDPAAPTGANNPAANTGLQGGGPTPDNTAGTNDPAASAPGTNSTGE